MSKLFVILTILIGINCMTGDLHGQQGQTGVGLRLGSDPGITIKHFLQPNGAIEGIVHTGYRGLLVTGLYEWHKPIVEAEVPGLKLFAGAGGHFGAFNRYKYYEHYYYYEGLYVYSRPSIGPDAIIGIEYDFREIPLNLGLDLKTGVDFYSGNSYVYTDGALSVRVLF